MKHSAMKRSMKHRMKHRIYVLFLIACFLTLLLAGCSQGGEATSLNPLIGSVEGAKIEKTSAGEDLFFTIPIDQSFVDSDQTIAIRAAGEIETGGLRIIFRDPDGKTAWDPGEFGGTFTVNTFYKPERAGTYRLGVSWKEGTKATYDVSYQGDRLTPMVLLPGLGMILVAVAFTIYALRRGGTWGYLGLGALAWTVTVAIKFMIAIPLNPVVYQAIYNPDALWAPGSILFYVYVGALTGVTEVLLTWLLLRYTRLGYVPWNKVLAFGVGFGAFEALLLGLLNFGQMVTGLVAPQMMSAGDLANMLMANSLVFDLAPIIERIATILCHIFCNALLFYGVTTNRSRWLWVSFAFKTLLDTVAGFAQLWGVGTLERLWTIEAIIIVFGFVAWWGIRVLARRYPDLYVKQQQEPATVVQ